MSRDPITPFRTRSETASQSTRSIRMSRRAAFTRSAKPSWRGERHSFPRRDADVGVAATGLAGRSSTTDSAQHFGRPSSFKDTPSSGALSVPMVRFKDNWRLDVRPLTVFFRAARRHRSREGSQKIDQSMAIVAGTEQIPDRRISCLKSRARISDGSQTRFFAVHRKGLCP